MNASGQPVPPRRFQSVDVTKGEQAVANPNSGLIWEFTKEDQNGNGEIEFEEAFHRTVASVSLADDLLVAVDLTGWVHCFDTETGERYWHYDSDSWTTAQPLIVDQKVYVPDEDGDVAVFNLSADPSKAMKEINGEVSPINAKLDFGHAELTNMGHSVFTSPIFANGTLYIANRNRLFAIQQAEDRE